MYVEGEIGKEDNKIKTLDIDKVHKNITSLQDYWVLIVVSLNFKDEDYQISKTA